MADIKEVIINNPNDPGYVPIATTTTPGIASFKSDDFIVDTNGKVSSRYKGTQIWSTRTSLTSSSKSINMTDVEGIDTRQGTYPRVRDMLISKSGNDGTGAGLIFKITDVPASYSGKITIEYFDSIKGETGLIGETGPIALMVNEVATVDNEKDIIGYLTNPYNFATANFNRTPIVNEPFFAGIITIQQNHQAPSIDKYSMYIGSWQVTQVQSSIVKAKLNLFAPTKGSPGLTPGQVIISGDRVVVDSTLAPNIIAVTLKEAVPLSEFLIPSVGQQVQMLINDTATRWPVMSPLMVTEVVPVMNGGQMTGAYDIKLGAFNSNAPEGDLSTMLFVPVLTGPSGQDGAVGPQGPQGPQGVQGPKGDNGIGWNIKDTVDTVNELPSVGQEGDCYFVGTTIPRALYTWSPSKNIWLNQGTGLEGPQGIEGPQGAQGPQGQIGPMGGIQAIATYIANSADAEGSLQGQIVIAKDISNTPIGESLTGKMALITSVNNPEVSNVDAMGDIVVIGEKLGTLNYRVQMVVGDIRGPKGLAGKDGMPAIQYNGIYSLANMPTTSQTYELPTSYFNTTPYLNAVFELYVKNTLTNILYMTVLKVDSISNGACTCTVYDNIQPLKLTGDRGVNWRGNYVNTPSNDIYENDAFNYNGTSYIAQMNNPSVPPSANGDWGVLAQGAGKLYRHNIFITWGGTNGRQNQVAFNVIDNNSTQYNNYSFTNKLTSVLASGAIVNQYNGFYQMVFAVSNLGTGDFIFTSISPSMSDASITAILVAEPDVTLTDNVEILN